MAGEPADRCGLWLGQPKEETWEQLHAHFGTTEEEELRRELGDDFRWIWPARYKHPEGKPLFDKQRTSEAHGAGGVFADCEDVGEVEAFDWPEHDLLDYSEALEQLRNAGDVYRASGFWGTVFHDVAEFFGMESYFIKMYTHPEVVHAVTRHVTDFYVEANRRYFALVGDQIDALFFGNDFGTQRDLLISPAVFDEFIVPYIREMIDVGKEHGHQVILHSCGAVTKIIPTLIDLGVNALHPLQAKAADMNAETLAARFGGKIAFMGGIDTQDLLVNATPDQVKDDVRRVKDLLGPNLIVSPSHEAVLPNVPAENIEAMVEAAME